MHHDGHIVALMILSLWFSSTKLIGTPPPTKKTGGGGRVVKPLPLPFSHAPDLSIVLNVIQHDPGLIVALFLGMFLLLASGFIIIVAHIPVLVLMLRIDIYFCVGVLKRNRMGIKSVQLDSIHCDI